MTEQADRELEQRIEAAQFYGLLMEQRELLTLILEQDTAIHARLRVIAGWVAFMGVVLLVGITLTMCGAVLGVS